MRNGGPFDYIVVGSGAGGGTLAARLAEASCTVLLLEAGGDPRQLSGTNDDQPGINRLPDDYDVPSFHGFASENEAMRGTSLSGTMPLTRCSRRTRNTAETIAASRWTEFSTRGPEPWGGARRTTR